MSNPKNPGKNDPDDTDQRFSELTSELDYPSLSGPGPRDYSLVEDESDYIPPEPPKIPLPRGLRAWGILLVIGPILTLSVLGMALKSIPTPLVWGGCALIVLGAIALFWSLPTERNTPSEDGTYV